jgi:hypothetical protein
LQKDILFPKFHAGIDPGLHVRPKSLCTRLPILPVYPAVGLGCSIITSRGIEAYRVETLATDLRLERNAVITYSEYRAGLGFT